jgi:hypothetical protein
MTSHILTLPLAEVAESLFCHPRAFVRMSAVILSVGKYEGTMILA